MATAKTNDVFETLRLVDVSEHVEEKDTGSAKLKYLSWAWAWHEVRRRYPDATYEIVKNEQGLPYFVDPEMGIMTYTSVTICGETHSMWLPVMDGANNPMKLKPYEYQVKNYKFKYAKWNEAKKGYYDSYGNEQPEFITKKVEAASMFDINKTVMRCLTKNLAMFGIGLALYAGEDLFDDPTGNQGADAVETPKATNVIKKTETKEKPEENNNKTAETKQTEDVLGLEEVRKALDEKVKQITKSMSDEQKDKVAAYIKKKLGTVNYRLCENVEAMNELLKEMNKPKAA